YQNQTAHAPTEQTHYHKSAAVAFSRAWLLGAANRRVVRGVHLAHFHSNLDPSAAAAVGLRQPSGAYASDSDAGKEPVACPVLRGRLAGHSQSDHGSHRTAAGARHERLRSEE